MGYVVCTDFDSCNHKINKLILKIYCMIQGWVDLLISVLCNISCSFIIILIYFVNLSRSAVISH